VKAREEGNGKVVGINSIKVNGQEVSSEFVNKVNESLDNNSGASTGEVINNAIMKAAGQEVGQNNTAGQNTGIQEGIEKPAETVATIDNATKAEGVQENKGPFGALIDGAKNLAAGVAEAATSLGQAVGSIFGGNKGTSVPEKPEQQVIQLQQPLMKHQQRLMKQQ